MAQYMDKDALVADIERRINFNETLNAHSRLDECNAILSFIDTLEVKEVDLENIAAVEWDDYVKKIDGEPYNAYMLIKRNEYIELAKHFFELGLKVSDKSHSIWHDASEDVGNNERILVLDEERRGCVTTRESLISGYGEWGKGFCIWANVDDLLKI